MPEIAVLGNFVVDLIGKPIDRLPERGKLAIIDTFETHAGGNGPNTAGALGKLGADVAVIGRVGEDLYGRFLLEKLEGWGVHTGTVGRDPDATTGVTLVPVDSSGERSFIHQYGANGVFGPEHVPWEQLAGVRHFHFGGFFVLPRFDGHAAAGVLSEARRRGMTTSLDVCWDHEGRWMENLRPCLPHVDYLMPSLEEAEMLTGETEGSMIAMAMAALGHGALVLKMGSQGCYYFGPDDTYAIEAYRVDVRDTTGAGDCFIAGFLYAVLHGWDTYRALRFANACGARSVQEVGGVTGLAPAAEVEKWARRTGLRLSE